MVNKILITLVFIGFVLLASAVDVDAEKTVSFYNHSLNISNNITAQGYCNITSCYTIDDFLEGGWTSTALTDLDMAGYRLTDVGEIIMSGAIQGQNILPSQNMTYSLGNETNWYLNIYVGNVIAINITTGNLNSTIIDSQNMTSENLNSTNINSDDVIIENNLTIGGAEITVRDDVVIFKSTV